MNSYLCAISRTLLACLLLTGMARADELYPFSYEFPMTCPGGKEEVGSIEIEREPSHFRAIRRQFHQEAAKAGCEISPEFDEFARTMGQKFRSDAEGTMKLLHDSPPLSKQVTTVPVLAVPMICDKTRPLRDLTLHDDWLAPPGSKDGTALKTRSRIKMMDDIIAFQKETGCRLEPRALDLLWRYRSVAEREGYDFIQYAQQEFPADWEDYLSYRSAALVGTATTYEVLADCRGAKGHVFELWLWQPFEGTQTPSKNLAKAVKDSGLKKCKAVPPTDKFVGALALLADRTIRDFDPDNPWEKFDAYYCGLEARKVDECRRELPEDAVRNEPVAEAQEQVIQPEDDDPAGFGFTAREYFTQLKNAFVYVGNENLGLEFECAPSNTQYFCNADNKIVYVLSSAESSESQSDNVNITFNYEDTATASDYIKFRTILKVSNLLIIPPDKLVDVHNKIDAAVDAVEGGDFTTLGTLTFGPSETIMIDDIRVKISKRITDVVQINVNYRVIEE